MAKPARGCESHRCAVLCRLRKPDGDSPVGSELVAHVAWTSDFAVLLLADRHEADIHVACISQQHLCCLWEIRLQSIERSLANER